MLDLGGEHIRMPKLPLQYAAERYINVASSDLKRLTDGKIVLLDIWDYTCVNCIRTLPYIQSWHEKYKDLGLVIIGIHTPEFEFAKQRANVEAEMKRFGLTYPVILDNEYEMWNALANRAWPAKHIFDTKNKLRAQKYGEGHYQEFEAFIQKLLLERDPSVKLPELTPVIRESDKPGAVCYRTTPELYLGFERSRYGNETQVEMNKAKHYDAIEPHSPDSAHLIGEWEVKRQFARPIGGKPAQLVVSYQAKEVNLVIRPERSAGFKVYVDQDFGALPVQDRGADIREENGRTYIWVDSPRMYQLVNNKTFSRYTLTLTSDSPEFCAYAFTFTTDCIPPEED
jgi:thiol-disulfide isomerase/thioredoxin